MLRQILSEMYIDPDLLAELSEEQKHILFFKMREEQVRRWKEREAAVEKKETCPGKLRPRKDNGKSVKWKLGNDQEVWVWVMGEHQLDKPYDVICDEIIAERARQQAQKEAEELRKAQGKELTNTSETQSLHSDLSTASHWETQNVDERAADEKKSGQEAKEAATVKEERTQVFSSSPRSIHQMLADSINRSTVQGSQRKKVLMKKTQEEEMRRHEEERTKQIYKSWKEAQDSVQKSDKEDPEWQESLRKSKAADEKRRSIAKQARDDYRRLSQAAQKGRGTEGSQSSRGGGQRPARPPLPPKPILPTPSLPNGRPHSRNQVMQRIPSCLTQEEIIKWFKEEQLPLRAGYEKTSDTIAPWFHGILTLKKTDELLKTGVPGSFLVRVSAKMKGYVLSYLSREGCKHFLIDASTDSYSFLGVDQLQHRTLADLVEYHKEEPITSLGKELLLHPCGQQGQTLDYLPLFE
ncbi:SH2 domain-containing protein 4A [Ornithorhynchus anatinus]|uniref:SH2 domain containing 4A n=1 Tax=Ornithorhynchus anatinus TaxID=9258 RepID=F6WCR5_ORNAN|nr:SH2 domain-containing protein 4A [Ornithorhynchus anatinus]XP_007662685.2 SH2 domain-containing protein 4A [Ornithorhynchus anatinus]XP_028922559.1 SH2 domain-containing protein 4A [Ornithorhynchus anatinus]XP_028922560.1 SH2 domain-containing protein 4A [Ornithorhynchus anatinus]